VITFNKLIHVFHSIVYCTNGEQTISSTLTSFADPFKVRFRLPIDNLLLTNFQKVPPVFDPFAFLSEFSETSVRSLVTTHWTIKLAVDLLLFLYSVCPLCDTGSRLFV